MEVKKHCWVRFFDWMWAVTNNEGLPFWISFPLPAIVEISLFRPFFSCLPYPSRPLFSRAPTPLSPASPPLFMRRFRGGQLSWHLTLPNIYEGVIDASVNICCKLKLVFSEKRLTSFRVDSILKWRVYIKLKVAWLRQAVIESKAVVYELTKRTQEMLFADWAQQLKIQIIFCAQSGASIRLTVWKWSGESRYPGPFPPVLEN